MKNKTLCLNTVIGGQMSAKFCSELRELKANCSSLRIQNHCLEVIVVDVSSVIGVVLLHNDIDLLDRDVLAEFGESFDEFILVDVAIIV